jgi:hypothetical protein
MKPNTPLRLALEHVEPKAGTTPSVAASDKTSELIFKSLIDRISFLTSKTATFLHPPARIVVVPVGEQSELD